MSAQATRRPGRNDPSAAICTVISIQRDWGRNVLRVMQNFTNQSSLKQVLPATISYINNPQNQNQLTQGGTACRTFFTGLQTQLETDLKKANQTGENIRHQLMQMLTDLNPLSALIG